MERAHLDVACPAVQVQVHVADLAKLAELVVDGLLVGLLVHVGGHDDPALDGAHGSRLGVRLHGGQLGGAGVVVGAGGVGTLLDGLVDFHFVRGHFVCWVCGFFY